MTNSGKVQTGNPFGDLEEAPSLCSPPQGFLSLCFPCMFSGNLKQAMGENSFIQRMYVSASYGREQDLANSASFICKCEGSVSYPCLCLNH